MDRKQQADVKYRSKFYELGFDADFDYIGFEKKDRIWFRCKRCGLEAPRCKDMLTGRQAKMFCRNCGNGMVLYSHKVNEVLAYYAEGHSLKETADKFELKKTQVQNWAKCRKVSNGRTFVEGGRECNQKRSAGELPMPTGSKEIVEQKAKDHQAARLKELGFEYIEGNKADKFTIRCLTCGCVFIRNYSSLYRKINCPECSELKRQELRSKKIEERTLELEQKKNERRARKEKSKQDEIDCLNAPHMCKVCGQTYTINDYIKSAGTKYKKDTGCCSFGCKKKDQRLRRKKRDSMRGPHSEHHYDRAKRLGLPAERGVTLKKIYQRDNGMCQICGLMCIYPGNPLSNLYPSIDHLIPMGNDPHKEGGHTWKNVQLAHRVCNSIKSKKRGKEWNNTEGGDQT